MKIINDNIGQNEISLKTFYAIKNFGFLGNLKNTMKIILFLSQVCILLLRVLHKRMSNGAIINRNFKMFLCNYIMDKATFMVE